MDNVTITDLYNLIREISGQNKQLKDEHIQTRSDIKEEIRTIRSELLEEIKELKEENAQLKKTNCKLEEKLNKVDSKLRKYNLIAYGIPEKPTEIEDIQAFLEIVNNTIRVDCRFTDLRDIHRLGKSKEAKERPLLIEFVNFKLKIDILKNAKNLKGTNVFLTHDLTPAEYVKNKVLREALKLAKEKNCKALIRNNILYVNDKPYTYDQLKNRTAFGGNITVGNVDIEHQSRSAEKVLPSSPSQPKTQKTQRGQAESTITPTNTDLPFDFQMDGSIKKRKTTIEESVQPNKRTTRNNQNIKKI